MKKRIRLKIFSIMIAATIAAILVFPGQASAWSGVTGNNTHNAIDEAAYAILSQDPAFRNVNFPSLKAIQDNDWVNPATLTGPGPDVVGQSNASSHYYNPRLKAHQSNAGGGPDAVKDEYIKLVNMLSSGNPLPTRPHYAADVNSLS